jgi:F1F0 ATPase subunit 2
MKGGAPPMNEISNLTLCSLAGAALGAIFFGGLWWTVRAGLGSKVPAIWFFGSLGLRMAAVVAGFYFVSHGDWRNALACLLGFLAARISTLWLTKPTAASAP